MDYKRTRETIVTIAIPSITGIILGVLEVFGKEYLTPIMLVGMGAILLFILLNLAIKFLEGREQRWIKNKEVHKLLESKVNKLEHINETISESLKINEKINKLENEVSYLKGRIK